MANNKIRPIQEEESSAIVRELHIEDAVTETASEEDILAKYDAGQARIITQRNDFLVPNLLQMVRDRDVLNLSPKYQRRKRWSDAKRSHLIESLLMNIPIPPIFLYERDLAKYEVMDGQQRLDAIESFLQNQFALEKLKKWPELNGRRFTELPQRIQAGLMRRGLAAVIILTESGQTPEAALEIRQYVFERLNTGGEKLNAQEIRNAIYASHFNDMLIRVARSDSFTSAWGIPSREPGEPNRISQELARNRLYATMADAEIVLRYFTLRDMSAFKGGMKRSLDTCMQRMRTVNKKQCDAMHREYEDVLLTARDVFGPGLFRLPNAQGELAGRRSVPLSDAVLLGIHALGSSARRLRASRSSIIAATRRLLKNTATYEALVGRGNTRDAVEARLSLMAATFRKAIRA